MEIGALAAADDRREVTDSMIEQIDCRCGHPYDAHDSADDEPGPCFATATPHDPAGDCECDAYVPADYDAEVRFEQRFVR
jgi:hypothetical protein